MGSSNYHFILRICFIIEKQMHQQTDLCKEMNVASLPTVGILMAYNKLGTRLLGQTATRKQKEFYCGKGTLTGWSTTVKQEFLL